MCVGEQRARGDLQRAAGGAGAEGGDPGRRGPVCAGEDDGDGDHDDDDDDDDDDVQAGGPLNLTCVAANLVQQEAVRLLPLVTWTHRHTHTLSYRSHYVWHTSIF